MLQKFEWSHHFFSFTHEICILKRYWMCQYCHMAVLGPFGDKATMEYSWNFMCRNCWAYKITASTWKHLKATCLGDIYRIFFLWEFCIFCPFHLKIP